MYGIIELDAHDLSDPEREVAENVATCLKAYLLAEEGLRADEVLVQRQIRRSFSTIFFFEAKLAHDSRRFVAKKITHPPINRSVTQRSNQAVVEYGVLQRLQEAFSSLQGLGVPRPTLLLPEYEAYVMEYVEGEMLVNCFNAVKHLQPWRTFHQLAGRYSQVGEWLRHFQRFTMAGLRGVEGLDEVWERCTLVAERIDTNKSPRLPKNFAASVLTRLDELRLQIKPGSIPCCGWHHDFGPWNMIVDKDRLTVIDFLGYSIGPVVLDPLKVLISLHDEAVYVTNSTGRIRTLRERFLAGYAPLPRASAEAVLMCEALYRLSSVVASLGAKNERPDRQLARRVILKRHVKWLYDEGIRSSSWPESLDHAQVH